MTKPNNTHVAVRFERINSKGEWEPTGSTEAFGLSAQYLANTRQYIDEAMRNAELRADRRNPRIVLSVHIEIPVSSIDEAIRFKDADWQPVNVAAPEPMVARIPGTMRATYLDGKIDKLWFSPAAAHPGYQGGSFEIESGQSYLDEEDDRPFWDAMTTHLAVGNPIDWEG